MNKSGIRDRISPTEYFLVLAKGFNFMYASVLFTIFIFFGSFKVSVADTRSYR